MIYIKKENEPTCLKKYKSSDKFEDLIGGDKGELRKSLLVEQGYLCAYCMKRISKDSDIKIEHYESRNDENQLKYSNLLAVCRGNEGYPYKMQTCDTRKGNKYLYVNPQDKIHIYKIIYESSGSIKSTDDRINYDLNNTLNLNYEYGYLKLNRKVVLDKLKNKISQEVKEGKNTKAFLMKVKTRIEYLDSNGEYKEYCGILLWYINKKLKSYD